MKILVIGGTGMLGSSIMLSDTTNELWGTYLGEKPSSKRILELDITEGKNVSGLINDLNPDAIIHTAAITNVDFCEKNPDVAKKVHTEGTKNVLLVAKEIGAHFIYISTDSVFTTEKGYFKEEDIPSPVNVYAKTKYDGEKETTKYKDSCIIRTNIYGYSWLPKHSIAEWILNSLREKKPLNLFKDVNFSPLLVNNLAEILLEIIEQNLTGLYHVACPEGISKLDFGLKIAELYNFDKGLINPISISQLDLSAPRPLNPTLDCSKIQQKLKSQLLDVDQGLAFFKKLSYSDYLQALKNL